MPHSFRPISLRLASLAAAAALLLAACEPYKVVEPGRQAIADGMSVSKTKPWVQIQEPYAPDGPDRVWTLDGLGLNALLIYGGVEDGEKLLEPKGEAGERIPSFASTMDGLELSELIGASVSRAMAGGLAVETLSLAPATFMGAPGFETEFAFTGSSGLEMRGFAQGANVGGKLYLVMFVAPRMHYYAKDLDEVRGIAASAAGGATAAL